MLSRTASTEALPQAAATTWKHAVIIAIRVHSKTVLPEATHLLNAAPTRAPHEGDTNLKSTGESISIRFGFASSKPLC
jgi:hypothetical protein